MEFRLLTQIPRLRHLVRPALVLAALGTAAAVVAFATGSSTPSRTFQLHAPAGFHPTVVKGGKSSQGDGDAVHEDKSPPLRTIPPAAWPHPGEKRLHEEHQVPHATVSSGADPVIQTAAPTRAAPTAGTSFAGLGNGFSGPSGTMSVDAIPPDDNGAVGPNHYVAGRQREPRRLQQDGHGRLRPGADEHDLERLRRRLPGQQRRRRDRRVRPAGGPLGDQPVLGHDDAVPAVRRGLDGRRPDGLLLPLLVLSTGRRSPTTRSSGSGRTRTT